MSATIGSRFVKAVIALFAGGIKAWDEFVNPPTADVDYFVTTSSTAASQVVITSFANTVALDPPRNITFTASNSADFDAVAMVVEGTDKYGRVLTETITLTNGGNTTDSGVKCFRTVSRITIPAQSGVGGSYTIGFGPVMGLSKKIKVRQAVPVVLKEIAAGSGNPTAGTFTTPTTSPPFGSYSPNSAPNASRDYAILYEVDET